MELLASLCASMENSIPLAPTRPPLALVNLEGWILLLIWSTPDLVLPAVAGGGEAVEFEDQRDEKHNCSDCQPDGPHGYAALLPLGFGGGHAGGPETDLRPVRSR